MLLKNIVLEKKSDKRLYTVWFYLYDVLREEKWIYGNTNKQKRRKKNI